MPRLNAVMSLVSVAIDVVGLSPEPARPPCLDHLCEMGLKMLVMFHRDQETPSPRRNFQRCCRLVVPRNAGLPPR